MHIHILGICGTFMGGVALLAKALGHTVSGSDANVYPPMSTQLESQGIRLMEGFHHEHLDPIPDCVVIGNALSRGNPAVEYVLDHAIPYTSGPQWLAEHVLQGRWILAVAGTHGKTTTASMLAWILEDAGMAPGFLIGGIPADFGVSARLGDTPFFVVEADEYDTAFFDKRSKFVHYHPRTLVLNNLEYDHADIFPDLAAIQRQFHHLIRTVPGTGLLISPADDEALAEVFAMGCWTPREDIADDGRLATWQIDEVSADGGSFQVTCEGRPLEPVTWPLSGRHNRLNGIAAIAAARHAGVPPHIAIEALNSFQGVKRRMEVRGEVAGITVYDDFAHHPTAIESTIAGLRARVGQAQIIAVLEPRSNTMRMGVHAEQLAASLGAADHVVIYRPEDLEWDLTAVVQGLNGAAVLCESIDTVVDNVVSHSRPGDHILVMSNGGFGGVHERLLSALAAHHAD